MANKHRRLTWQQQVTNVARTQRHHTMENRQIIEERQVTTIYISVTLLAGNKHKRSQTQIYQRKHLATTVTSTKKYRTH